MEEWRDIPSLPGYQASSKGRIRSLDRVFTDTAGRQQVHKGCVRALNTAPNGYLRFSTSHGSRSVHRAVLEAFVGEAPQGYHGAHADGDRGNNALSNLRWASPVENAADKIAHGTAYRPIGALHHMAKLTEEQVLSVKRMHARGILQAHIALQTGIDRKTINRIVRGKSWKHIRLDQQSDMRAMGRVG